MPKELIQRPEIDYPDYWGTGTELSIHWDRGLSLVQLGMTRHVIAPIDSDARVSPLHADHSHCPECVRSVALNADRAKTAEGSQMMTASTSSPAPPVGEFDPPATVFTNNLSRSQINRMIETLRRARDQAYGKDA